MNIKPQQSVHEDESIQLGVDNFYALLISTDTSVE